MSTGNVEEHAADLFREIEAIEYEHWMLRATAETISDRWQNLDVVLQNALVESHAMHLRNLIEFLFHHTVKPKKVMRGSGFVGAWRAEPQPDQFAALYGRASEEIAHLSRGRVSIPKTHWKMAHAAQVLEHFDRWLSMAAEDIKQHFKACQSRRHLAGKPPAITMVESAARATNSPIVSCNTIAAPPWSND